MPVKPPDTGRFIHHSPKLLLLVFLVIGLAVYDDYGISWDESFSYNECGMTAWNALVHGAWDDYLANQEKYHGPAFELVLIAVEKLTGTEAYRDVYLLRHLVTYLLFWISGAAIYGILRLRYKNTFIILAGICFYFMMPRIFADAFYNSKDLAFLSMIAISLYSLVMFLEKPGFFWAVVHGLFTGFATDIRIMGIIMAAITLFLFILPVIVPSGKLKHQLKIPHLLVYLVATTGSILAFWPILWLDPVGHFIAAWKEMSHFAFQMNVLYAGKLIPAFELPWHYLVTWIAITTPPAQLFFFLSGIIYYTLSLIRIGKRPGPEMAYYPFVLCVLCFGPLVSVIALDSVVYDGWRHMYFVYVPFCLIAAEGLNALVTGLTNQLISRFVRIAVVCTLAATGYFMIRWHPYQHIYFNRLAGTDAGDARFRYELDYWGLSYREALEKLLDQNPADTLLVYTRNNPGYLNSFILPDHERRRIQYTGEGDCAFYITNFRSDTSDHQIYVKTDSIVVDGAVISATYTCR